MSKFILTDGSVVVNGVDLSDHAFSLDIPLSREVIDVSGFSPTAAKESLPGQKTEEITVGFLQDFAASKVDATLYPLYSSGSQFLVTVKPTSSSPSATNPTYSGTVILSTYSPISGQLNARSEITATFNAATSTGITRGTA
jgi:hypothetical protein